MNFTTQALIQINVEKTLRNFVSIKVCKFDSHGKQCKGSNKEKNEAHWKFSNFGHSWMFPDILLQTYLAQKSVLFLFFLEMFAFVHYKLFVVLSNHSACD